MRSLQWTDHCNRKELGYTAGDESVAMDRPLQQQTDCNERELGCVAMGDECVARGDQLALQWWQTRMLQ